MRSLLPVVLLAACDRQEGALQRAIEASLADCTYTFEWYDHDGALGHVGRGEYDMNGDLVLEESSDPLTGEVSWRWEASYGAPHEVAVSRSSEPVGDAASWVETTDWIDGLRIRVVTDREDDGIADAVSFFDYGSDRNVRREQQDDDGDGAWDAELRWTWDELEDGWAYEQTRATVGVDTPESWGRVDRQRRTLNVYAYEGLWEYVAQGYGALTWPETEAETVMIRPGNGWVVTVRRTLDGDGRVLDMTVQRDEWSEGALVGSSTSRTVREWTCPR
jgi:hypothetical protein